MSGWLFGKVSFPMAPRKIIFKTPASIKKIPVMFEAPWLMSMGPDTKQLSLEGEFFEGSKALSTIYTNVCKPLENYASQKMIIDQIIMNDAFGSGTWHASATITFEDQSTTYLKDEEAIHVQFTGAGGGGIYQSFANTRNFKDHNFVSLWAKGSNGKIMKVTFYNESFGSRADGYRGYLTIASAVWTQMFIAISGEDYATAFTNTVGNPSGWNAIQSILIEPSSTVLGTDDYYFDQMVVGQGWRLAAPGTRYDGVYAIANFQIEEGDGNIRSFRYRMDLMDKSEMYGTT